MFLVAAPGPLDLDRGDMVHGEAMVLEQAPRQRHLVSCLDEAGAEIAHRLVLALRHVIKVGGEELLSQAL